MSESYDGQKRPAGSNADEWALFLQEHSPLVNAVPYLAVQIATALDEANGADVWPLPPGGPQHTAVVRFYEEDHRDALLAAVRERDQFENWYQIEKVRAEEAEARGKMTFAAFETAIRQRDETVAQRDALAAALDDAVAEIRAWRSKHPQDSDGAISSSYVGPTLTRAKDALSYRESPAGRQLDQENG